MYLDIRISLFRLNKGTDFILSVYIYLRTICASAYASAIVVYFELP